jgi:hypothetical protein
MHFTTAALVVLVVCRTAQTLQCRALCPDAEWKVRVSIPDEERDRGRGRENLAKGNDQLFLGLRTRARRAERAMQRASEPERAADGGGGCNARRGVADLRSGFGASGAWYPSSNCIPRRARVVCTRHLFYISPQPRRLVVCRGEPCEVDRTSWGPSRTGHSNVTSCFGGRHPLVPAMPCGLCARPIHAVHSDRRL